LTKKETEKLLVSEWIGDKVAFLILKLNCYVENCELTASGRLKESLFGAVANPRRAGVLART
jgi:hypothetical protein